MNKKILMLFFIVLFLGFAINSVNAATSFCCEKTINGAWCQNAPESECAENFRKVQTSCEATAYCKLGTCVDVKEGLCQENTPQRVCEDNGGAWYNEDKEQLSQCRLGCCILGNQGAFVTQNRCKTLASIYRIESIFRNDIKNQLECVMSVTSDVKGACVIEKEGLRDCKMLTQAECRDLQTGNSQNSGNLIGDLFNGDEDELEIKISFHEGYLCSADNLATNCGPRGGTICHEEKVYFTDTCGNIANIYDYSRRNNAEYWTYIVNAENSCGYGQSNAESRECGNCNYYAGSICKAYRESGSPAPLYGEHICADLSCEYKGERYEHGEVWCDTNTREGLDFALPGSESFKIICYNGEITVEPCDPWRATICTATEIEGFSYATCRANLWQDCTSQKNEQDCLNNEKRDCIWIEGYSVLKDDEGKELKLKNLEEKEIRASCVPKYSPGFDFWNSQSESSSICDIGEYYCVVKYKYNIFRDKETIEEKRELQRKFCVENCKCIPGYEVGDAKNCEKGCESNAKFIESVQGICGSMGDCGISVNYLGNEGYYEKYEIDFTEIE